MASDIRLSVGFFAHPKSLKLERRLGPSAVVALIRLWCWTAQHRPSGVLEGLDAEDLELAVGWIGEPGTLIATLLVLPARAGMDRLTARSGPKCRSAPRSRGDGPMMDNSD